MFVVVVGVGIESAPKLTPSRPRNSSEGEGGRRGISGTSSGAVRANREKTTIRLIETKIKAEIKVNPIVKALNKAQPKLLRRLSRINRSRTVRRRRRRLFPRVVLMLIVVIRVVLVEVDDLDALCGPFDAAEAWKREIAKATGELERGGRGEAERHSG